MHEWMERFKKKLLRVACTRPRIYEAIKKGGRGGGGGKESG